MATDLKALAESRQAGRMAAAVNRAYPGASSLINSTARKMRQVEDAELQGNGRQLLTQADERWGSTELWRSILQVGRIYTDTYFLTALDLDRNADGEIQQRESSRI